uniref:Uncharacterized protein n=1 Tax=Arundo donax TaxID=35708 RepID=A0A0A9ADC9_ARUDO
MHLPRHLGATSRMSAAVCSSTPRTWASSFFEDQQHSPHAGSPLPSKRARSEPGSRGQSAERRSRRFIPRRKGIPRPWAQPSNPPVEELAGR